MPVLRAADLVYVLPEMVLAATALLVLLVDAFAGRKSSEPAGPQSGATETAPQGVAGYLAVVGILIAMATIRRADGAGDAILGGMVANDGFAAFFKAVFLIATALVALVSIDYVARRQIAAGEYFSLLLLATTGALFMAGSAHVLTLYIGLELLSLSSYALAGLMRDDPRSQEASLKYFLNGALSSGVLLFGISLLYGATGTFDLAELGQQIGQGLTGGGELGAAGGRSLLVLGLAFVLAGLAFKVGAVPFHLWLPDAYQGAPTPITAYLAVASEGAAFAAILRVFNPAARGDAWQVAVVVLAVVTMTVANLAALRQTDVKRLMAYSSIAQAGYILAAVGVATDLSRSAVLFYVMAYTFMNVGAFAVISTLQAQGEGQEVRDLAGLARRTPALAWLLAVFLWSLIGLPPTAGFLAKFSVFRALIQVGNYWLPVVIALNSVVSVGYYYKLVRSMFVIPAERQPVPDAPVHVPAPVWTVLLVCVFFTVVLGLWPETFLGWAAVSAANLAGL